jgi:S-(hydroxymethyl)glutathione dehydrogenase/alcohol dehydrogenase
MPFIIDLYRRGLVKLDELVSATYPLEEYETVIHEMEGGNLARGVLTF